MVSELEIIDLRSDTVTKPSKAMREAMANAEVGDDVYSDDPTINLLEKTVAEFFGFESCVYVPSGSMANHVAIRTHTRPGDEVFSSKGAHLLCYEAGASALAGVQVTQIGEDEGTFSTEHLKEVHYEPNLHSFNPSVVAFENTHNRGGGTVWKLDQLQSARSFAAEKGYKTHMDGARLWNASVASRTSLIDFTRGFDTVSVCFSKGLGAPVGSALMGNSETINRARKVRKQQGGGMRQAGIIAAGALFALNRFIDEKGEFLARDHDGALEFSKALSDFPLFKVKKPETNILLFEIPSVWGAAQFVDSCKNEGLLLNPFTQTVVRAVTHQDLQGHWVKAALDKISRVYESYSK